MKWFTGEVSIAIQKAIQEEKVFIVFVKDEKEDSAKMEEIWNDDQVAEVCTEEKCVAINITSHSTPGQQFGAIYPIMCVPTTYLINNQGMPADIIPGVIEKDEFTKRLKDAIEKTLLSTMGGRETQNTAIVAEHTSNIDEIELVADSEKPCTSSSVEAEQTITEAPIQNSTNLAEDIITTEQEKNNENEEPTKVDENLNDEYDEELTTQEQSMLSMLKEKVRVKKEEYEKQCEDELKGDNDEELTTQEQTQLSMLREKVKVKREEGEKQKLKDTEKKRRDVGKDLQEAQRGIAEKQAKELAAEIANRKSEDKAAREKVKEQIRLDRLEKTRKFDTQKKERDEALRKKAETASAQVEKKKTDTSNMTRLQFRLPDGSAVSNQFNADAKFLLAESFIKGHIQTTSSVRLTTVYPKHEFNSEDMLKSFRELGLVPNASIIVSTLRELRSSPSLSFDPLAIILFILAPLFYLWSWVTSLFTGSSNNTSQPAQQQQTESSQQTENISRNATLHRRNLQTNSPSRGSNMNRLRSEQDDDDNATWNGNSTQQM